MAVATEAAREATAAALEAMGNRAAKAGVDNRAVVEARAGVAMATAAEVAGEVSKPTLVRVTAKAMEEVRPEDRAVTRATALLPTAVSATLVSDTTDIHHNTNDPLNIFGVYHGRRLMFLRQLRDFFCSPSNTFKFLFCDSVQAAARATAAWPAAEARAAVVATVAAVAAMQAAASVINTKECYSFDTHRHNFISLY